VPAAVSFSAGDAVCAAAADDDDDDDDDENDGDDSSELRLLPVTANAPL
jgi:hypothetical protein